MIDELILSSTVHMSIGAFVLAVNLFFLLVVARLAWQNQALSLLGRATFIAFQAMLMLQALAGIKLLDQGSGAKQLYIHYLGGLAPMAFCLLFYWIATKNETTKSRQLTGVALASFFFVLLTFVVGGMAARGEL